MTLRPALTLVALLLFFASGAMADGFDLTATSTVADSTSLNISLVLTGSLSGTPGVYDITGITGTVNGISVSKALPGAGIILDSPVVNGWYIEYDNLLSVSAPYFDLYGLGFELANGSYANLYYNGSDLYAQLGDNPPFQEVVTVTSLVDPPNSTVPEPSTLALLCVGLLALGAWVTRKQVVLTASR